MEMEKSFDFKVLAEAAQAEGLPLLEDGAEKMAKVVFAWLEKSFEIYPNPIVKMVAVPVIQTVKPLAFDQIDKIDGQVG